jgi:3-oxoacyl-[acyl-carrier protein] reductase
MVTNLNCIKMKLLTGKTALITGSSRGIGAATAKLFAEHGANVVVNYANSEQSARSVIEEIEQAGGKAIAIKADVSNETEIKKMVTETMQRFGSIDILVLNASFSFPTVPFVQYQWIDFERKLMNEIKSAFICCKEVVPLMQEKKEGCIIAVSSGLSRTPGPGYIAHSTAKSGLDAFVKSLALELGADGIRVNAIAPGLTETDAISHVPAHIKQIMAEHTPLKRIAQVEDVAGAILMMASEQTKYITGVYIPVSGGNHML